MKALHHKAKLAFLMVDGSLFLQLEDGRMMMVEITRGQLVGLLADGVKFLFEHGAHESGAPPASATQSRPQSEVADALIPGVLK